MKYTTITKVRQQAGFVGNTNIADATIQNIIDLVESEINSSVVDAYQLPLPVFYKNTITFSGTGSGSATMTITIDSVNYTVAVTSGLTASEAADLFRTSVIAGSGDFILSDDLGHGALVTIISNNQSETPADVTISSTDPQTVQGIVATGGTIMGIAVPMIESIATGMAAAKLLIIEYGPESQGTDKDGYKLMALYQEMLDKIQSKDMKLIDPSGTEIPLSTAQSISGFPSQSDADDEDDPQDSFFSRNQKF